MADARRPPFDRWPVQHVVADYGHAWYCGGAIIVSHFAGTHGSLAAAEGYHEFEARMLVEHADEVAREKGIFVIHDWRSMATYDGAGRRAWQAHMERRPRGYLRGSIVCLTNMSSMLKMAVQAANLVMTVTQGVSLRVTQDLDAALAEYCLSGESVDRRRA